MAALSFVLAACGSKKEDPGGVVEPLKAAVSNAFIRHDATALAGLFADSAVVVAPDGRLLEGREAIQRVLTQLLPTVHGYSITSRRTVVDGDLAWDQETFQLALAADSGADRTITGHQLVILRRQADGAWKIVESGAWAAPPTPMTDMPGMPGMTH